MTDHTHPSIRRLGVLTSVLSVALIPPLASHLTGCGAPKKWFLKSIIKNHNIKNIKIVDEMFVLNKRHVHGICDLLIERDYNVNIWAYARVDTVKEEFLDKLKGAGINWLCLGIESGSDYVRDGADKTYNNNDITNVVRRIQDSGLYVMGNYIFGLPDDTKDRMQETLDLSLDLNCEFANFYSAMAYPGSPLYTDALNGGRELPQNWQQFSQHSYDSLPLANDHCSAAEILEFRDNSFNTYFSANNYLNMVRDKFGQNVVDHIVKMAEIPLKRKIIEEKNALNT
jgi:anaerobic magnesium-protoporphyrin IX monomethyl ester cyclase